MKKGRKVSGGRYIQSRKKKLYERKGQARIVKLEATKVKKIRTHGNKQKTVLLQADVANVFSKKTGKTKKAKIKNVLETISNRFLARQNILVKSAVIETELGKARITNRPSQEGFVQAELLE
ncbi:MAG: 30S ribosomal protein S8e [Nanoarchaeota archaeon]|nr:30S ribosomal protein S8e [Nanoarchaeota archaeon]